MSKILDEIRAAARWLAGKAHHVHIDDAGVQAISELLPGVNVIPTVDHSYFYNGPSMATAWYVMTLDAINFGSGWHPFLRKLAGRSGSITTMARLTAHFDRHGPLTPEELSTMTPSQLSRILDQPMTAPVGELLSLQAKSLNDLGHFLLTRFNGDVLALIHAAERSAEQLVEVLMEMPMFCDVARHSGRRIPILKRAQLAAADLHAALPGDPLGEFRDLDRLTVFADNLIPHVLCMDGALRIDAALARKIAQGQELVSGSPPEVELRACTIDAVERIVERAHAGGQSATSAGMDYFLWLRGQAPRYKNLPRPRCRSIYY